MAYKNFCNCGRLRGDVGKKVLNALFLTLLIAPLFLQSQVRDMEIPGAEKVYLQLSSTIYALDQPIWFKAIVTGANNNKPTDNSRVLHVELINQEEQRILHQKIKLEKGIGHGALDLNSSVGEGRYLIRAYTRWNKNFEDRFIFKEFIEIVSDSDLDYIRPFQDISFTLNENGKARFNGLINKDLRDLPDQKEIPLYLEGKNTKDTVSINKTKSRFSFTHKIPEKLNWLNISLRDRNYKKYTQTLRLKETVPDLQFLPESGKMVHGFQNKLGFKAIGENGKGIRLKGTIFNDQHTKITDFETNHLGMGVTGFKPDSTHSYYAKLESLNDLSYPLPKVYAKGSILSISKIRGKLQIKVASNNLKADYVYINISCRGRDYFLVEGPLHNGYLSKSLSAENLPRGILKFTLLNKERSPVGERLFFNESGKEKIKIQLDTDKENYCAREKTTLNIRTSGTGQDSAGLHLSAMAIKKEHWHQGRAENILSYFLLSSEIHGTIEEPGFYFRENGLPHFEDLDALLLTQAWRNYKYPATIASDSLVLPQRGIELTGRLNLPFKQKESPKNVKINLATFGGESGFYSGTTDNQGRFNFILEDEYGTIPLFLNTQNDAKHKINYQIHIEPDNPPVIMYEVAPDYIERHSLLEPLRAIQKQRKNTKNPFSIDGINQLDEVLLSGKGAKSKDLARYEKYGEPDVIIPGEELKAKEKKWSYGLYSILLFNYGDQIEIERFPDGFMLAHIRACRGEPTLLLIDGQLLKKHQYDLVPHMDPGVVERVELIKYAKFF